MAAPVDTAPVVAAPSNTTSTDTTYGVGPTETTADGEVVPVPHVYYTSETGGGTAGVGLVSAPIGDGGEMDLVAANAHYGTSEGNYGVTAEASVASVDLPLGAIAPNVGGSVNALSAEGSAYIGPQSASIGAGASLVGGSVAVGTDEHNLELGGSVGLGAGGRVHYGDEDNDGVSEYGLGAELGPVSVDFQSEALGHAANAVGDVAGGAKDVVSGLLDW